MRLNDAAKSLYRVLFLFQPGRVSFQSMRKARLLTFIDPTDTFIATYEFYKYEPALYFAARRTQVEGRGSNIISGMPGSDNGARLATKEGRRWCGMLQEILDREWEVYGGNNFNV